MSERRPDCMPVVARYQTAIYYADSLFQLGQFKKAEQIYMKALHLRKNTVNKSLESKKSAATGMDFITEAEVKFRLQKCLRGQEKYQEAIGVIESIPVRNRSPKIKAALATLYREMGKENQATENYKDLIKDSPFSLDVIVELLTLGYSPEQLEGKLAESAGADGFEQMDWFEDWFRAQAAMASRDYGDAIARLKDLDAESSVANRWELSQLRLQSLYTKAVHQILSF